MCTMNNFCLTSTANPSCCGQVWSNEAPGGTATFHNPVAAESSAPQGCSLEVLSVGSPFQAYYNANSGSTAAGAADRDLVCFPIGDACADAAHCTTLSPSPPPSPPPPSPPPSTPPLMPPPAAPPPSTPSSSDVTSTPGFIGGVIGGAVALVGCCIFLAIMTKKKREKEHDPNTQPQKATV